MPIDRPEDRAVVDPGDGKPMVEGDDRGVPGSAEGDTDLSACAFLIGFGAAQHDDYPLPDALDVVAVEADQLRPPEPAREAIAGKRLIRK